MGSERMPKPEAAPVYRPSSRYEPPAYARMSAGRAPDERLHRTAVSGASRSPWVSSPEDAAEREAERVARAVVRAPLANQEEFLRRMRARHALAHQRLVAAGVLAPLREDPTPEVQQESASGTPLPATVRETLEPRFGADFSGVRVHTDARAAQLAVRLDAVAFTRAHHVFFAAGAFRPESQAGLELVAHELVHVIQQRAAGPARPALGIAQSSPVRLQRLGLGDALARLGEAAAHVPGFSLLTFVLGFNPLSGRVIVRDAVSLLRAVAGLVPGGEALFQALSCHGVIERAGVWAREELGSLGLDGAVVRRALEGFVASLGLGDLLRPNAVLERARRLFAEPVGRVVAFARRLGAGALRLLRSAALRPLVRLAEPTRGYELLRLVLERDPLTGEAYPRTAERMIGGFLRLIGEEEKWAQLQQARAVPRTWAWLQQESPAVLALVHEAPPTFARAWDSLEARDLLDLGGAFLRVRGLFTGFVGRLGTWARRMGLQAVTFMLEVLAPGAMPILRRAASVVQTIARDPVRFAGHLVRAAKQGFQRFVSHIGTHLRAGLVGWLTGALGGLGIQLPAQWDVRGILSVALQVLGITWPGVRPKLVRHLGERVVSVLETTFELVSTLVRKGPAAAWRQIAERLGNVQERVLGQVREWVARTVVGRAVLRIAMMLNPAGAVIQALLTTYESVMFFRERATQILQVVESLFDSLGRIASGDVSGAAAYVEATMARTVPVVISFLARLLNLGGITDRIQAILRRIREPVDRALDRAVEWIVAQARRLGRAVAGSLRRRGSQAPDSRTPEQKRAALNAAVAETRRIDPRIGRRKVLRKLAQIRERHRLTELTGTPDAHGHLRVHGAINPEVTLEIADFDDQLLDDLAAAFNAATRRIADLTAADRDEATVLRIIADEVRERHAGAVISLQRAGRGTVDVMATVIGRPAIQVGRVDLASGRTEMGDDVAIRARLLEARIALEAVPENARWSVAEAAFRNAVLPVLNGRTLEFRGAQDGLGREAWLVTRPQDRRLLGIIVHPRAMRYQQMAERGTQSLFRHRITGIEFVFDARNLMVPRYVWRNLNEVDRRILTDRGEEFAPGAFPDLPPRPMDPTAVHLAGEVARKPFTHVINARMASVFSSATAVRGGEIVNRTTQQVFNENGRIHIDLYQVDSNRIRTLASAQGRLVWGIMRTATPQQAERDAIATREVLIRGGIPGNAILRFDP